MSVYLTDLQIGGCRIYQDTEGYAFTQDSVFLANLARIGTRDKVLDLGCGCGILAILAIVKKHAKSAVGIEADPHFAELAEMSARLNGIDGVFNVINGDVRDIDTLIEAESFDKVLCNPPYFAGDIPDGCDRGRASCRRQLNGDLSSFIHAAERALRFGGELFIVYKAELLSPLYAELAAHRLEPKHTVFVQPKLGHPIDTVIVRAKKGAKPSQTNEIFVVHNADGTYTDRAKELYD